MQCIMPIPDRLVIIVKRLFNQSDLLMLRKKLGLLPSKNQVLLVLFSEVNWLFILYFCPEVLSFTSEEAKLITEIFSEISSLDNTGTFLPGFPLATNLRL